MLLKGNVLVKIELGKKTYDAKPLGVAFGNWFFGVINFTDQQRSPTLRAPDQTELVNAFPGYWYCPDCRVYQRQDVESCFCGAHRPTRSVGG